MPKTKISEYSATNSSNTDIEGINIDEGCPPSSINNAIRELMVHLKEFQTGASGDAFTFAGGTLMSGTNTISGAAVISGNINSSGTTNTFSGGNILSGTNTISGSAIISGNINSSGTNTFSGSQVISGNINASGTTSTFSGNVVLSSTGAFKVPTGTEAQRPGSPTTGMFRFNDDSDQFEGYNGSAWGAVGGGNSTANGLWEHANTIVANYTISSGNNALSGGPITVASGVTVTVPSGSAWTVV